MYKESGSSNWRDKVLTQKGYVKISWRTPDKEIATAMLAMWKHLAKKRAWDLVDAVISGATAVGTLYDRYKAVSGDIDALRAQGTVVDLSTKVDDFMASYNAREVNTDSKARAKRHVDYLIATLPALLAEEVQDQSIPHSERPTDTRPLLSNASPARLGKLLDRVKASSSTRRVMHSSWSTFFRWLHDTYPKLLPISPMAGVKRPAQNKVLPRFYRMPQVKKLIAAAPNEEIADIWTFMYGTGAGEISAVLKITSDDVHFQDGDDGQAVLMVRVRGEKAADRDRLCHVAEWARPAVDRRIRMSEPGQPIWSYRDRSFVSHAHTKTVRELGLPEYPMYNARHHWAVTWLEAGVPVELVQHQLGHATPQMTLEKYGRFLPKAADYARWQARAVLPHLVLQEGKKRPVKKKAKAKK